MTFPCTIPALNTPPSVGQRCSAQAVGISAQRGTDAPFCHSGVPLPWRETLHLERPHPCHLHRNVLSFLLLLTQITTLSGLKQHKFILLRHFLEARSLRSVSLAKVKMLAGPVPLRDSGGESVSLPFSVPLGCLVIWPVAPSSNWFQSTYHLLLFCSQISPCFPLIRTHVITSGGHPDNPG